jgi:protein-L-isoaspartate(D-aspartate) O-methyltransferase
MTDNPDQDARDQQARANMVAQQLKPRGIRNPRVLAAMGRVPRHLFVPEALGAFAYDDGALPIEAEQTISQPFVVALMTQLMGLAGGERVLEIGTGSGYQAAVLAEIAEEVITIERHEILATRASERLRLLGYSNITVVHADGSSGYPEQSPYDAAMIAAAAPHVTQSVLRQLRDGGRLVVPVGGQKGQVLQVWQRTGSSFKHRAISKVAFVPLRGELGWASQEWE